MSHKAKTIPRRKYSHTHTHTHTRARARARARAGEWIKRCVRTLQRVGVNVKGNRVMQTEKCCPAQQCGDLQEVHITLPAPRLQKLRYLRPAAETKRRDSEAQFDMIPQKLMTYPRNALNRKSTGKPFMLGEHVFRVCCIKINGAEIHFQCTQVLRW
jgi:hypothetical protein